MTAVVIEQDTVVRRDIIQTAQSDKGPLLQARRYFRHQRIRQRDGCRVEVGKRDFANLHEQQPLTQWDKRRQLVVGNANHRQPRTSYDSSQV